MATQTVGSISVANQAGFDLKYAVEYGDDTTSYTSSYPIDQTQSIDLTPYNIPDGTVIYPIIHADGGKTKNGTSVIYDSSSNNTATYVVSGATLTFSVDLQ